MQNDYLKLCLITNLKDNSIAQYKHFLLNVIAGGITCVQLRNKSKNFNERYQFASQLKSILYPFKIPLIINDYIDLAREIDADGVHLGQNDESVFYARKTLGANKIIGLSVETLEELHSANQLTCINYVAISAVFPSKTKTDCKTIWGLNGLKKFVTMSKHPVVAIGGIEIDNVKEIIKLGANGIAVSHAIHSADDPKNTVIKFRKEINYL